MKYKLGLIFICLIICLFSIASVCAADVNETLAINDDSSEYVMTIENEDLDNVSVTEENELSATTGTFTDLDNDIKNISSELICYESDETLSSFDDKIMSFPIDKDVLGDTNSYPYYYQYTVDVSDNVVDYSSGGEIKIFVTSTYYIRYNFYLKIYDSNDVEIISKKYDTSGGYIIPAGITTETIKETTFDYKINSAQLDLGVYTIKIVNYIDDYVMDTAKLVVKSLLYSDYSVNVSDTVINYGTNGSIDISIFPAFNKNCKYDFYLKVFDSFVVEKISQRFFSNSNDYSICYDFDYAMLDPGVYTIKILNAYDNEIMDTAKLVVKSLLYSDYSVSVSDTVINYGTNGSIDMSIFPAFNKDYTYDFYLKVFDSFAVEKISQRFFSNSNIYSICYDLDYAMLDPGVYTILILNTYDNEIMDTANLFYATNEYNITKLNSTCSIILNNHVNNSTSVQVTLNEDATGQVNITINNTKYTRNLIEGMVTFNISNLPSGTYFVLIEYEGDSKYNSIHTIKSLKVNLKQSTINFNVNNILNGRNGVINPIVTEGATGILKIYLDDVFKTAIKVGSFYTIYQPEIGKHEVKLVYTGDDYFESSWTTTVFRVFAIYPIESQDKKILFNSDEYFQAKFYDEYGYLLANKYVIFNVNGTDYAKKTNSDGIAILDLKLPIGFYNISIANPTVNENTNNNLLIFSSIGAADMVRAYNSGVDFNATFLDESAKALSNSIIIFKVNGTDYSVFTDINGVAELNVPLGIGTYEIISINTQTSENTTNRLTILPSIQADDMIKAYNSSIDYQATFFDKATNLLDNTEITFEIGLNTYRVMTNGNGQAILNVPLAVGEYNITSINPVTNERLTKKLTILERIIENKDMMLFTDSQDYFKVRIVNDDGTICGSGQTVVFTFNNANYNVETDSAGYASLLISLLNKGKYPITVTYKGFTVSNNILVFEDLQSIITINVNDAEYNQKVILNVSVLPEYKYGNLTIDITGANGYYREFNQTASNVFYHELTGLNASDYVIAVKFIDKDNYYMSGDTDIFEVLKINPNIIVVTNGAEFGQNATITVNIPQASGNVTIKIGDEKVFNEFIQKDGVIVKRISDLPVGEYEVVVTYNGNENFNPLTKTERLNITNLPSHVELISEFKFDYGQEIVVNLTSDVDGRVRVQFDEEVQFIDVIANNIYQLRYSHYDAGYYYHIEAILTPTDNTYGISSDDYYIEILPISPNLYVYAYDIELDQPTNITVILDNNVKGIVRLELDNVNYTEDITDGKAIFHIDGLKLGNYTVYAYFDGNNNFLEDYGWNTFKVTKVENPEIEIPEDIEGGDGTFSFNLPLDATGNVSIIIDGKTYSVGVINGAVNIDLSNLANGNYDYTLVYSGDDKYSQFTRNGTIHINTVIPTIEAENMTIDYGSDYDFKASFFDSNGSPLANAYVVFEVDGEEHMTKTDSYGLAVLKIGLNAGTYAITSVNTRTGETKINTLIVNSIPSQLDSSNVATVYNGGKYLVVMLKDINGNIISGVKLTVVLNGKTYAPTTDANGQVRVSTNGLAPKIYNAEITFAGNSNYAKSTASAKVTVTKATPKITAKAKTFKRTVKTKKYSITLKTNQNKVMKSTKVYIKVNKKTYTAKTNSKGVATFKITKLTKKGRYTAVVTYKGNAYYNKLTKKVKITVK